MNDQKSFPEVAEVLPNPVEKASEHWEEILDVVFYSSTANNCDITVAVGFYDEELTDQSEKNKFEDILFSLAWLKMLIVVTF